MPVIQPAEIWQKSGPLGRHPRDVQAEGPLGTRHGPRHDARGGHRVAGRPRDPLLPRPAADLVPDPDQGAGRGPAALGRAAHARVRDEGLLHARPRRGRARPLLRRPRARLPDDLRAVRAALPRRPLRHRHDGRPRRPRVPGAVRGRRGRDRAVRGLRLRGQRRDRPRGAGGAGLPGREPGGGRHAERADDRPGQRAC